MNRVLDKIRYARYGFELKLKNNFQRLEGVLLESNGAYSLLQPWPTLGDQSLQDHLEDLKGERALSLTRRALQLLEIEASAKEAGLSLVPTNCPPSHLLLDVTKSSLQQIPLELKAGVSVFKIKIGDNPEEELRFLKEIEFLLSDHAFNIRLDANMKFDAPSAASFFSRLTDKLLCAVEFVEDPIFGSEEEWVGFSSHFDLKIAHDFAPIAFQEVSDVWILKPSREDPWAKVEAAAKQLKRIVVTSALDHPLGHVVAAWEAARIVEEHPLLIDQCGLISFESQTGELPFNRKGAYLDFSNLETKGFGLDSILRKNIPDHVWETL